ncbi:hypothetical protein fugu_014166 [Takifugu bimaculatus]|uniref:Sushi domain-containing protein n=1 Tax=Takifugu bimaculatus TaxID=433685 RepID=A0A4Z2C2J8_9TELE|nr:hypothetical protein fugu_014166 [Takifugu bimaculatus]
MLGARLVFGLLWFPGLLNAQKAGRPCQPPKLDDGYFVPQQTTYLHEEQISYACEKGHKKVLGGWWATSKCLDGNWSHNPQCIKSPEACLPPPKIPHGVITDGPYRDLFEVDSSVKYKCEDGYTIKGTTSGDKIFCISGNWTEVPKCIKTSGQAGGEGGATGTGGKPGTSTGTSPGTGPGTSPGTAPGTSTTPGGFPSGSTSIKDQYVTTLSCGTRPVVTNGALVQVTTSYLRYQCVRYYKLVGPDTVYCRSSGLWTQVPVCEDNYCYLNTALYPALEDTNHYFLDINEKRDLKCVHQRRWKTEHYSRAYCTSSRIVTFYKWTLLKPNLQPFKTDGMSRNLADFNRANRRRDV